MNLSGGQKARGTYIIECLACPVWFPDECMCIQCHWLELSIPAHLCCSWMMFYLLVCQVFFSFCSKIYSVSYDIHAVDAHTAHHLFYECLKGDLMRGRTIILVSRRVQLCTPGASYIVALDNGRVQFQGSREDFQVSGVLSALSQSNATDPADAKDEAAAARSAEVPSVEEAAEDRQLGLEATTGEPSSETSSTVAPTTNATLPVAESKPEKKARRRLVEEEKWAVGRISKDIWLTSLKACGGALYWTTFATSLVLAAASPVLENLWLK